MGDLKLSQKFYECLFLLDSNKYARDAGGVSRQVNEMIEKCDGTIRASRLWNEQRLAYPIKGQRKGTYWLTFFDMDSSKLAEFNRACQLNANVLRHLVVKHDDRLAETLVAHALGESIETPAPSDGEGESDNKAATAEGKDSAAEPETVEAGANQ